jgi:hypothetical protein
LVLESFCCRNLRAAGSDQTVAVGPLQHGCRRGPGENNSREWVGQGHRDDQGRLGGGESGVHGRQSGEHLRVTCKCSDERLQGLGSPGEETAVQVNHT